MYATVTLMNSRNKCIFTCKFFLFHVHVAVDMTQLQDISSFLVQPGDCMDLTPHCGGSMTLHMPGGGGGGGGSRIHVLYGEVLRFSL